MEKIKEFLFEPGPVKTPFFAASGWFTWSTVKGTLEAFVLVSTAVIVGCHAATAILRRWCPKRRFGDCGSCPLKCSFFCPRGLNKDDEND